MLQTKNATIENDVENEDTALLVGKVPKGEMEFLELLPASCRPAVYIMMIAVVLMVLLVLRPTYLSEIQQHTVAEVFTSNPSKCTQSPCFKPSKVTVESKPGFPSFLDVANKGRIDVSYDSRSIRINDERVLLLGGSIHPSRATKQTWGYALDEIVANGLNLVTIYVMWENHQPVPTMDMNWDFLKGIQYEGSTSSIALKWNLASAIRSAAERGLFVHLRIGPYECAEYTYGGIPEFIPLQHPSMSMRRPNLEWLEVMKLYVEQLLTYLDDNKLWAYQGGPIILGQIENELGGNVDAEAENFFLINERGDFVERKDMPSGPARGLRNATLQDYADWCGSLVQDLAPNVTWTMCNGLSAENTILTCNGISECADFLESHGFNGRVQVDQPPMLTEFEGGFQIWGEDPHNPSDYFWGRPASVMAHDALRWFARGGTHLNHYMFWGSYNRGRQAAAGITNMYAKEAMLCPSGQRHQPKFGHFQALHQALASLAPILLASESALEKGQQVEILNDDGKWEYGDDQLLYQYQADEHSRDVVSILENNANTSVITRFGHNVIVMDPYSSILLKNEIREFDSSVIGPRFQAFERVFSKGQHGPKLLDWEDWQEPIGAPSNLPATVVANHPIEQTKLNVDAQVYSDYAWYETTFHMDTDGQAASLVLEAQRANGFVVFIDDVFVGSADDHFHMEGPISFSIDIVDIEGGSRKLSILSESLGYHNLIGRWGVGTKPKSKGLTGDVVLVSSSGKNASLVDGREWRSFPGLHGEAISNQGLSRRHFEKNLLPSTSTTPTWASVVFDTPIYEPRTQGLFLRLTTGRGHLFLNGYDLGRHWNITTDETGKYTQEYYFLPPDYVHSDGNLNELTIFNSLPDNRVSAELLVSWTVATDSPNFQDEINFQNACL
ncbi:unnamed protein product [Cylindrotheca closterium]|uniref:Beta-galactosidase n=1 Tax=Cylindrotheca closterium TaxID=2856 RepID=A0AAD2GD61_9STRA|nr:unnamed protein product [Cylindrotheca closterium]